MMKKLQIIVSLFVVAGVTVYFWDSIPSWLFLVYLIGPIMFWLLLMTFSFIAKSTELLIIKPNRFRPSDYDATIVEGSQPTYPSDNFGFFTKIEDGRAMVKVIGDTFLTAFMQAPGLSFKGHHHAEISKRNDEYWEVIHTPRGKNDTTPLTGYSWFSWKTLVFGTYNTAWRLWETATFKWFGLVFIAWPIVSLRIYPIEYFEEAKTADGKFKLMRRLDYSNHYRVFDFQFFVPMDSLDTADLIPVSAVLSEIMRVVNVYKIAFKSDNNWVSRLFARIPSVVNEITNKLPVADVVGSKEQRLTERLEPELKALTEEGGPLHSIGLAFAPHSLTLPDRSVKNEVDEHRLGEVARAEVDRQARQKRAEGDAYAIKVNKEAAIKGDKEAGLELARIEGQVRQAEAAGKAGGTVIIGNTAGVIANPQPRGDT